MILNQIRLNVLFAYKDVGSILSKNSSNQNNSFVYVIMICQWYIVVVVICAPTLSATLPN